MGLKIDAKNIYTGYIPGVEDTIYVVPSGRAAIIKSLHVCNETGSTRTVNIRVVDGSNFARLVPYNFQLGPYCMSYLCDSVTMDTGDRIFAVCDQQLSVTLKINGVEEQL